MSGSFKLSIVIPVFNEEGVISEVLQELLQFAQGRDWEIIVVDDGSTDKTAEKIAFFDVKLISNLSNKGYGASLKAGIRQAGADHILIMDGDGQHNPKEIEKLLPYTEDYTLVIGSRNTIFHSDFWRMPGKWFITSLANYLTRQKIPDLNSGFRIFSKKFILKYLAICPDRFSFSTTSLIAFLSDGHPVKFIDIEIRKRIGKSTVTVKTGLETILLVLRIVALFNPLRIFIPVSFLMSSTGIFYFLFSYLVLDRGSISALFIFLIGALIFFFGLVSDQIARFRRELTG